jgi:hypothetical protein
MLNLTAIAATYSLRQHGHRYTGPCPKCGGSATSDKFQIREAAGIVCDRPACDVWDTCRMGSNAGQPRARRPHSVTVPYKTETKPRTTPQRDPASIWLACAAAHPHINVIALGSVGMPPTTAQTVLLKSTPVILVSLDADPESAAGQKSIRKAFNELPASLWKEVHHAE